MSVRSTMARFASVKACWKLGSWNRSRGSSSEATSCGEVPFSRELERLRLAGRPASGGVGLGDKVLRSLELSVTLLSAAATSDIPRLGLGSERRMFPRVWSILAIDPRGVAS